MLRKTPKLFFFFLGIILVINLLQASFTELIYDEAYYWYYAQNLSWGYFDHPPMVAWLIKISSLFFEGELGVRFMSCLLSILTLLVLWVTIDHPKKKDYVVHFFVVAFSTTLLNAYGFFTLPDTPLLFFTALFLLVYKRFITAPSTLYAVVLGLVMAALMYSKYHAVLVIVFVLLSNLKLLRNKYAWLAVLIALISYIPHFLWLYENDFVSIKYHLFERPNQAYNFNKFTLGYFVNLIALFGFTFPLVYYILYKSKSQDRFQKALVFLTYGVLLFFFISSFSKRVQTQWIIVISIPMVILVFQYILDHEKIRKWVYGLGIANICILMILRVGLVYKPLFPMYNEPHGNKVWAQKIADEVGKKPVVFENSYRYAPMYAFYSGNTSFTLNNIKYRKNQYSLDDSEATVQDKDILYISHYMPPNELAFSLSNGKVHHGRYIENFESFRRLVCFLESDAVDFKHDQELTLKVFNPYKKDIPLEKLRFGIGYTNDYKKVIDVKPLQVETVNSKNLTLKSNDTLSFTFKLPKSELNKPGYFKIGISENGLHYGLNSAAIKLK